MKAFEIFFLNNGSAVFQTEDFCHAYDDMGQMANDFAEYQTSGTTNDWEGNEPEFRLAYDGETERNGGYLCVTDGCWSDLDCEWGYNVKQFAQALDASGFSS